MEKQSADRLSELHRMHRIAQGLQSAIDELVGSKHVPDEVGGLLRGIKQTAKTAAKDAETRFRVGVVGSIKMAKSSLLNVLLGHWKLLPSESIACTGNLTEITIKRGQPKSPTRFLNAKFEFLDHVHFEGCCNYLLGKLNGFDTKIPLECLSKLENSPEGAKLIADWCVQNWKSDFPDETRQTLFELASISTYWQCCGRAVRDRIHATNDWDLFVASVTLPRQVAVPEKPDLAQLLKKVEPLNRLPDDLSAQDIGELYRLVRSVTLTVEVSSDLWPFFESPDIQDLTLFDCPGLGSLSSFGRDEYLCKDALKTVHTILLLRSAEESRDNSADLKIDRWLREAFGDISQRVILGITKFDLLDRTYLPDKLNRLTGKVTPDQLLQAVAKLDELVKSSTMGKRQVPYALISSYVMLSSLLSTPSGDKVSGVDSDDFRSIQAAVDSYAPLREAWSRIATMLDGHRPNDQLTRALLAFTKDGGREYLLLMIQNHLRSHGLEQVYSKASSSYKKLGLEYQQLWRTIKTLSATSDDLTGILRRKVSIVLKGQIDDFQNGDNAWTRKCLPIHKYVGETVRTLIYRWPKWSNVLIEMSRGMVRSSNANANLPPGIKRPEQRLQTARSGESFLADFEAAVQDTWNAVRKLISDALAEFLSELGKQIDDLSANTEAGVAYEDPFLTGDYYTKTLFSHYNNHWSTKFPDVDTTSIFPLQREQVYSWAFEAPSAFPINHQLQMLRIRNELVVSAEEALRSLVDNVFDELEYQLGVVLKQIQIGLTQSQEAGRTTDENPVVLEEIRSFLPESIELLEAEQRGRN